uniref:ANK_REP_REGION domain-containing protein n=1 Tax=Steinernema glaseri TaxID=37863 RepID=A0A1I7ZGU7_9BILA
MFLPRLTRKRKEEYWMALEMRLWMRVQLVEFAFRPMRMSCEAERSVDIRIALTLGCILRLGNWISTLNMEEEAWEFSFNQDRLKTASDFGINDFHYGISLQRPEEALGILLSRPDLDFRAPMASPTVLRSQLRSKCKPGRLEPSSLWLRNIDSVQSHSSGRTPR